MGAILTTDLLLEWDNLSTLQKMFCLCLAVIAFKYIQRKGLKNIIADIIDLIVSIVGDVVTGVMKAI
jgi:hypothetical protein